MENQPQVNAPAPAESADGAVAAAPRRRGGRGVLAVVALLGLLLALAALGGGGWLYWQLRTLDAELAELRSSTQARWDSLGSHEAVRALDERTRMLAERAAQRFAGLDKSIAALEETVLGAARQQVRDERGWRLAEIEYILRIAIHRLVLLQDVDGAIAALQTADHHLHLLGSPVFLPLRESIAQQIQALRGVTRPDLPGIAIRLAGLVAQVPGLAPAAPAVGVQDQDGAQQPAKGMLWRVLDRFVTIKRNDPAAGKVPAPYVPGSGARALVATLRAAQEATMRADQSEYQRLLESARVALEHGFDTRTENATAFAHELSELSRQPLHAALPDISVTLTLLDELRREPGDGTSASQ